MATSKHNHALSQRRRIAPVDWRSRLAAPVRVDASVAYLADALERDLERSAPAGTIRTARSVLARIRLDLGVLSIRDLTPEIVVAWIEARIAAGAAHKTVRRDLWFLRRLNELAVELRAAEVNAVDSIPRRHRPRNRVIDRMRAHLEVLSGPEVKALLSCRAIPAERRLLWAILLYTGARVGEAAALRWADWTPRAPLGELTIGRSWDTKAKAFAATKTDLVRHIPVHPRLAQLLRAARRWATHELIAPYRVPRSGGRMHPWNSGVALAHWHRDLDEAGIEHPGSGPRRLHAARHTFATHAVRCGADWRAVSMITHSPLEHRGATLGQYVHLGWPDLCQAMRKLRYER